MAFNVHFNIVCFIFAFNKNNNNNNKSTVNKCKTFCLIAMMKHHKGNIAFTQTIPSQRFSVCAYTSTNEAHQPTYFVDDQAQCR